MNPKANSFLHRQTAYEKDFLSLLEAALCCNNARINPPGPEHPIWTSLGDQTEAALKVAALKYNIDENAVSVFLPRVHEIPFDARRKRMTTIHREDGPRNCLCKRRTPRSIAIMFPYPG